MRRKASHGGTPCVKIRARACQGSFSGRDDCNSGPNVVRQGSTFSRLAARLGLATYKLAKCDLRLYLLATKNSPPRSVRHSRTG